MYRILLVDDCIPDLNGIQSYIDFKELNCSVVDTATNGEEGYLKAVKLKPDIIITDVSMTKADGITMMKNIKKEIPSIEYIFISCFDDFSYIKSAMDENAFAYVLKPIKIEELTNAIKKLCDLIEKRRNAEASKSILKLASSTLAEAFFTNVLLGNEIDYDYAELLNITLSDKYHCIFLTSDNIISSVEKNRIRKDIELFFENNSSDSLNFYLTGISIVNLCILVNSAADASLIKKLSDTLTKPGYIAIYDDLAEISHIKEKINKMLYDSQAGFISYTGADRVMIDTVSIQKELSSLFFVHDKESIKQFVNKYYLDSNHDNINYLKSLTVMIINHSSSILSEYNRSFSDIFGDEFLVWNKVMNFTSILNIQNWIENFIQSICDELNTNKTSENQSAAIAQKIKEYIDENYFSFTIVEDVAEYVSLSVNYSNTIFKKHFSTTLFKYTTQKRIESAKDLLKDKGLSLSEIASKTGYTTGAYFSSAFKKSTGLSPAQYRAMLQ